LSQNGGWVPFISPGSAVCQKSAWRRKNAAHLVAAMLTTWLSGNAHNKSSVVIQETRENVLTFLTWFAHGESIMPRSKSSASADLLSHHRLALGLQRLVELLEAGN
jgi:hypothetical protein